MRKSLLLLPLIALAACGTPREQCINGANRALVTLDRLIAETQGNVNRGFALREVQDVRVRRGTCQGVNEDGTTFTFSCEKTDTFTRNEPVAINLAEETLKLNQLLDRRAEAAAGVQAQINQCIAIHPE